MRIKFFILAFLFLFFQVGSVSAGDPPVLLTPTNGTTVTSSRLKWQTPSYPLYTSNPYRVQVDDDPSFSSLNKDYYTNNIYYTPTLSFGTWYWKVKAKDSSSIWSDWSTIWSFVLTDSTPSPSPTQTQSPTPTPSPTSTAQPASSFTVSGIPSQINSDQSFTVLINLSLSSSPNTNFYLKGAFKKTDSSNYFGLTKVSGNWVKNSSSYSSQYFITTNNSGNWSGNLEVEPDIDDSGYTGSGDYKFKVARYDQDGTNLTWSNESTIKIDSVSGVLSENSSTSQSTPKSSPSNSPSPTILRSLTQNPTESPKHTYRIASVAGTQTSTTSGVKVEVKNQRQINPIVWVGLLLVFAGSGLIGYIYLKKNGKIPF